MYDETLAERIRAVLRTRGALGERRMFGGLCFMLDGHMAAGVMGGDLMLRLGEERADRALDEPHVRPMDFTGRPMRNLVYVARAGVETDADLQRWLEEAAAFVATLPARTPRRGAAPG
jgi:TfoX/Sxy family transcriptional regulator of competence genes